MSRIHATFLEEVAALSATGKSPITLRDWFAGRVLAFACSEEGPETAAILAYQYADAMLAQREKQP